ncbi:hypothetical protein ACFFSW_19205 [Saccharothrix longispora]|uniref:Peptidase inhibitor family I36 n=1 Tax=Saccharothrix longispora TaxID=33920 RepID=A0ABU1Q3Z9_9PSEU|nr:hypothetical protein [Saccharothrix longispora]MDR6597596.1 hypothetical protein [Saccharothrix longispora]
MRIVKTAAAVALTVSGLIAGGGAATAAPADAYDPNAPYRVTTWHQVNERSCPSSACAYLGTIPAWTSTIAYCWYQGEPVTDAGITNDVWLLVSQQDGGQWWSSAVYFQGDAYANLPGHAACQGHQLPRG